ncbi:MAG: hypothetical protein LC776_17570, partial [Acidobacteria bacterium]|nr:hypothetical protein [Acidobacteriota bacterium]
SPGAQISFNLLWLFSSACAEKVSAGVIHALSTDEDFLSIVVGGQRVNNPGPIGSALSYQYSSSTMHVVWLAGLSEACRQKCLPQPSIRVGMGRSPHAAYAQRVK